MAYLSLGFLTGLSLIFVIGAQNIFVIEQGLKKQYTFLVCFICSVSDLILIFIGILIFMTPQHMQLSHMMNHSIISLLIYRNSLWRVMESQQINQGI